MLSVVVEEPYRMAVRELQSLEVAAKQTETSENLPDAIVMQHRSKFINTRYIL